MNKTQLLEISQALLLLKFSKNNRPLIGLNRNTNERRSVGKPIGFKILTRGNKNKLLPNPISCDKVQKKTKDKSLCPQNEGLTKIEKTIEAFLNRKPKPSWPARLNILSEFFPTLISGWSFNKEKSYFNKNAHTTEKNLCIKKNLFRLIAKLTQNKQDKKSFNKIYTSAQRGVEVYLISSGYLRINKYSRSYLSFQKIDL
ncbi:hypothetical protein M0812_27497 [Anaeramoeba flamelloides]|uniref:Ribosomal protein S3 n=1 Tax=Anaeramoeba flamelloides TaxID=1746091 RepID=A0AAV7YAC1_9EUKA|nr:hypothetical protein M0812_27497 [Anaeramoeba flamelloides]